MSLALLGAALSLQLLPDDASLPRSNESQPQPSGHSRSNESRPFIIRRYDNDSHAEIIHRLTGEWLYYHSTAACRRVRLPASSPSPRGNRSFAFLHLHKSGGTSICEMARANAESMDALQGRHNCAAMGDGNWLKEMGIGPGYSKSCAQRAQMTSSFMAIERWLDREVCTGTSSYGIVVREPVDRIISNTLYERAAWGWAATPEEIVGSVLPGATVHLDGDAEGQPTEMIARGTAAYDNFLVRSLAGPDAFRKPAGSLGRAELRQAKQALLQFDAVMVLDEFDEHSVQLSQFERWSNLVLLHSNARKEHWGDNPFTDEQMATIVAANKLDAEFYCFAKALAAARTEAAKQGGNALSAGKQLKRMRDAKQLDHSGGVGGAGEASGGR